MQPSGALQTRLPVPGRRMGPVSKAVIQGLPAAPRGGEMPLLYEQPTGKGCSGQRVGRACPLSSQAHLVVPGRDAVQAVVFLQQVDRLAQETGEELQVQVVADRDTTGTGPLPPPGSSQPPNTPESRVEE